MFQIDDPTAVGVMPALGAAGTQGWFTSGNPGSNIPATLVTQDFLNILQAELMNILTAASVTPTKATLTQLKQALDVLYRGGRLLNVQVITSTQTYTPTTGTNKVRVVGCGGGGAGGGTPANATGFSSAGSPGSAGSWFDTWITSAFSGVTVTIGAGGVGASNANGGNGGATSFGALATAPGGVGGIVGVSTNAFPLATFGASSPAPASGGSIQNGTGEGGLGSIDLSATNVSAHRSGGSCFGPGQVSGSQNSAGAAATSPGCGGCGPISTQGTGALAGGNGAAGRVVIWEYA